MLNEYLKMKESCETLLPLVHTTLFSSAKIILKDEAIEPQRCPVFEKELSYLFYGKQEYRKRIVGTTANPSLGNFYVCFVFSPISINPYSIFPFDTGAWYKKYYKKIYGFHGEFDAKSANSRFLMGNSLECLPKYVSTFWGSNDNYLEDLCVDALPANTPNCIQEVYNLIKSRPKKVDGRKHTPEIITDQVINLRLQKPIAAIIHSYCKNTIDDSVAQFCLKLDELGISFRDYTFGTKGLASDRPNEYISEIKRIIREKVIPDAIKGAIK